jgi:hypothetical protein
MILVSKSVGAGAAHNVTCWTCYESPRVTAAASWRTQGAAAWQSAQMNFMVLEPQSRKLISPPRKPPALYARCCCLHPCARSIARNDHRGAAMPTSQLLARITDVFFTLIHCPCPPPPDQLLTADITSTAPPAMHLRNMPRRHCVARPPRACDRRSLKPTGRGAA